MSDNEQPQEKPFFVDRAKSGRAGCKKCKQKIDSGSLRLAKLGYNPFGTGMMKMWHHVPCLFDVFKRQRATTKKIEVVDDIGGWEDISKEDQDEIKSNMPPDMLKTFEGSKITVKQPPANTSKPDPGPAKEHKDNSFREFRRLCYDITNDNSHTAKTEIVRKLFQKGTDGKSFKGDVEMWCRLLLPGVIKRVYNLQSKQLVKIFSRIFETSQEEMLEDLEKGDVSETIGNFFENSKKVQPSSKAVLTMQQVDEFLEELSKLTKEDEQTYHFKKILKLCTSNDLKTIIRLVKHDLRMNAGPKPILEGLHENAYAAFQTTRDISVVVKEALASQNSKQPNSPTKGMKIELKLMTPVLPMLAQACTSIEMAMKKCPNGMYSEIKYDGERVQLHKEGNTFKYFSRSLKPVLPHKVNHFKDFIPDAFPHGEDLILDSEILLVDHATGQPLPFGTLGKHKTHEFKNASVCLFVFDCIYYNGESLMKKTIKERKKILQKNMKEIKNHVMFSEMEEIHDPKDLEDMITKVIRHGLEGLVLKDINSVYEPGKRHWLKVKKDYLCGGALADTADLVVLGAWYGTGNKGGIMSSFLMGCWEGKRWVTVTKVSNGHDDATLNRIQKELSMVKISKDASRVPDWLKCTKTMIPDFVAEDPKNMPVWEITGAEFTCNQVHTADGISIRFPRVTKIRDDKDWETATSLKELKALYEKSKDMSDFTFAGSSKDEKSPSKAGSTKRKLNYDSDETEEDEPKKKEDKKDKSRKKKKHDSDETEEDEPKKKEDKKDTPSKRKKHESHKEKRDRRYEDSSSKTDKSERSSSKKKFKYDSDEDSAEESKNGKNEKPKKSPKDKVPSDGYGSETEEETNVQTDSPTLKIENPLPDIFDNLVLEIPTTYKDYGFLKRYIIAYGGKLFNKERNLSLENGAEKVTHVIHLSDDVSDVDKCPHWADSVRHVNVKWVWDSIKLLQKQKENQYLLSK